MRSKAGMIVVALLATVAFSSIAASAASAADEWFIGGTKLSALAVHSAALATKAPVDEFATLTINPKGGTTEVQVKCEGANLTGVEAYISAGGGGMAKSLVFEKCKVTKPTTGCELVAEGVTKNLRNVSTNALGVTTLLVGSPTKVSINIKPLTKNTFAILPFVEGENCLAGIGEAPVNGSVLILSSDGATEAVTHTIMAQGSLENNSLEVAGDKSIIEGGLALVKLASGQSWSFHA